MFLHITLLNWLLGKGLYAESSDNKPIKHTTFIFFLGGVFLLSVIPYEQTLGVPAITNQTLFNVTHASIINFEFSSKFNNLPSTKNKTLCYQV